MKKVYFIGIGGIGVSALARLMRQKGFEVAGSDLVKSQVSESLEQAGIQVNYEQVKENITVDFDLVVYSAAVPEENPERQAAKELKIEQKNYFEMLGQVTKNYKTVAVSGTNGKSTTTAMLSKIMVEAEQDPSVILGSQSKDLEINCRKGDSEWFLLEACEYRAHMLLLNPFCIVLTNIEEDHLDYFKDLNHIIQTFQQYVKKLKPEGLLVINNDDLNTRKLDLPDCKIVKYGLIDGADVRADHIKKESGRQIFNVFYENNDLGEFELKVPGDFNIYNALAAIAFALALDIPVGKIKQSLKEFTGIWRRFEIVKDDKITVVSDYAHHPSAVKETIKATKEFYPDRRVVVVFEPHQHDRTKKLFDGFVESFDHADLVVLSEIYDVAGREELNTEVSSDDLVKAIKERLPEKEIYYTKDRNKAADLANSMLKENDVVIVMGAGDIYLIVESIKLNK